MIDDDLLIVCCFCNSRYTNPDILAFLLQCSAMDPRFKTLPYITDRQKGLHEKALMFVQKQQQQPVIFFILFICISVDALLTEALKVSIY